MADQKYEIEEDDFVTIDGNRLTWRVNFFSANGRVANLVSGQSGRRRKERIERLRLHTKAEK